MTKTSTSTSQPVPDATTPGSPAIAGGVFTRLNPVDGLFLRAEHLDRIERYASELVAAVGAGLGPGVVFGFTCRLNNDGVEATGGLAFAAGQPLQSTNTTTVSLKGLQPKTVDDFWVVEIVPATWEFGSEPVYGGLCEDPCGRGSGIHPYAAEGVELRLRRDSLQGFAGQECSLLRNWLASNYFEREREYGGTQNRSPNAPWLLPDTPSGSVDDITLHPWSKGTGAYDQTAVPLAVVWKCDGDWYLDVWTARRDRGEPTPEAAWKWRFGMRPWNVFIAQVLQFQDQLAQADSPAVRELPEYVKQALEYLGAGQELVGNIRSKYAEPAVGHLGKAYEALTGQAQQASLITLGFDELPPAGYLPWNFDGVQDRQAAAQALFGDGVDVRVRDCRADFVAHAIEQVQHMDRIPLKDHANGKPKIDLLIPTEPSDLKATWTGNYGWSAFVRRREDARDRVEVWVAKLGPNDPIGSLVDDIAGGKHPTVLEPAPRWTVSYPPAEWAVPILENDGINWEQVHAALRNMKDKDPDGHPLSLLAVVGVTQKIERHPLAAARATLFVTPEQVPGDVAVQLVDTYVALPASGWTEATVLVFGFAGGDEIPAPPAPAPQPGGSPVE
jgi:hypothetical protein